MRYGHIYVYILVTLIIMGCKKPYNPKIIDSTVSYLVVEGNLSINDTTTIRISRTVNISSKISTNPVPGALITVENDENVSFTFTERSKGNYVLNGLLPDIAHKYRVRIKTTDNKEYVSDFVQPQIAPPIDSVGYNIANNNVQLYVNAHNTADDGRFFRWTYGETWVIHTKFVSLFDVVTTPKTRVVYRLERNQISRCWSSDSSSTINIASSADLKQNVIFQAPLISIALSSEKFTERYSILVNQYALNSDAYIYYQRLKKNTEDLGSIFDAQPSSLTGNIHSTTDAYEPVIGLITASTVSHKRIFVDPAKLPQTVLTLPYSGCNQDTLLYTNSYYNNFFYGVEIPISAVVDPQNTKDTLGYTGASPECVDCTLRGTNKQPGFWR